MSTVTIPLCLNGAAGAELHVPFPIIARSSFGFLASKGAIIIRMITALFWHGEFKSLSLLIGQFNAADRRSHSYTDILRIYGHDPSHPRHLAVVS